jgi:hypothetical protein
MRLLGTTLAAGLLLAATTTGANAALITANLEDETNGGGFFSIVTLEDIGVDTVRVTLDISDPINAGLTQGDILGVWFDVNDESVLPGLQTAFDADPTTVFGNISPVGTIQTAEFDANSVQDFGGPPSVIINPLGPFDIGIQVGTQGGGGGFNQLVSFDFIGVTTALFADQHVGLRVQSIDSPNYNFGSSKLLGTTGTPPVDVPEPGMLAMLGTGLLGSALLTRRRRQA